MITSITSLSTIPDASALYLVPRVVKRWLEGCGQSSGVKSLGKTFNGMTCSEASITTKYCMHRQKLNNYTGALLEPLSHTEWPRRP